MNRTHVAVVAVVILGLAGVGLALYAGVGGVGPGGEEVVTNTPDSTGTVYEVGDRTGTGTGTGTEQVPPFSFVITEITECGDTCRDVTVDLTNNQADAATDVSVYTRVFAGNSTAESDKIWEGREVIGRMAAGETVTSTRRVELSFQEAIAVRNNDGWITIVTTVESNEVTITFVSEEQVA